MILTIRLYKPNNKIKIYIINLIDKYEAELLKKLIKLRNIVRVL